VLVDKAEERTRNVRLDILAVWQIEPNDVSWTVPESVACMVIIPHILKALMIAAALEGIIVDPQGLIKFVGITREA